MPADAILEEAGAAPEDSLAPLGSRLWLYANFDCNLACDYCCAESSPRAAARRMSVETAARAVDEFAGLGGREVLITGGEPFLHPQLSEIVAAAARWFRPTILTNAMLVGRGSRRQMLDRIDPASVTMQVSLDSGTSALHDAHRGPGSFDRARAGIELLRAAGFHVRVAATIDAADAREEADLHALLDADGVPLHDRLVRPVARAGFAEHGRQLTLDSLWPEPTFAEDGAWWHPVTIADPSFMVSRTALPVVTALAVIRATLNAPGEREAAFTAFRCV